MCNMELSGSGRRKLLPPELNQGLLFSFNGHQSIGEYIGHLDELLEAVKLELSASRTAWTIDVALELADLDSVLKHRSTGVIHERLFTGNWKVIEREPWALEEVRMKVGLFYDAQAVAFQRWQAMREGLRDLYSMGMGQRSKVDEAERARGFEWRGTATDAVELALALDVSGLLHFAPQTSQQERIKELVQKLGVEVAHLDQTLNQLMNRKAGPVKAIERMKAALVARQEVRDGR